MLSSLSQVQKLYGTPEGMTFDELSYTTVVLMVAGSETVATTLSGLTYYLCANPSVHARLKSEIRETFKTEKDINLASTNSLPYLGACINEALRIYPAAVGIMARITPPEGCIVAGRFVPGNTTVNVSRWGVSRSPSNFQKPDEFLPQRWLGGEEFEGENRKAVQPFNVGPRNCIGQNLAWAEMRVMAARLIWGFDMELEEVSKNWNEGQKVFMVFDKPSLWVKLRPVVRE
jgi:cytochrome P450